MSGEHRMHAAPGYQPALREIGLDAEAVFDRADVLPWRTLPDRENCTLDAALAGGRAVRYHVKRYAAPAPGKPTPARAEARGHELLSSAQIPTAPLVAWGELADKRSFVIFDDLAGYTPADKLLASGTSFVPLLRPTADLAAHLHRAGLHHRDLYLCHFMAKVSGDEPDLKLIDVARVRQLPGFLTRRRWIVKDLAQFWYSTLPQPITEGQRDAWLARYAEERGLVSGAGLKPAVERKARQIARHDASLRKKQPTRNVSIPH